jgi:hypothetical protein
MEMTHCALVFRCWLRHYAFQMKQSERTKRQDVTSAEWQAKDLNGKTVLFDIMETPVVCLRGKGSFHAIRRGNGMMGVKIETINKEETVPQGFNYIHLSQRDMPFLKKFPPGSECDFSLITTRPLKFRSNDYSFQLSNPLSDYGSPPR